MQSDRNLPNPIKTIALGAIAIAGLQGAVGGGIFYFSKDLEAAGQFGDVFGAVNALFSGLAFAGLIYTALLQRIELGLQRQELELTRKELARTAVAQEQSEIALKAQAAATVQAARLNATNFLLEHYKTKLSEFHGRAYAMGDPRHTERLGLLAKERALVAILDKTFDELVKPAEKA
jgi:hypothetical protein